jgi:uncharacterized repeat protein (TIGR01451 family)
MLILFKAATKFVALKFVSAGGVGLLIVLGALNALALAQEPQPFEINVIPGAEQAVAGQNFTYTVVITNIGQLSFRDIIVLTQTPTQTTFVSTYQSSHWLVGAPLPGETGIIAWNSSESITPTDIATFELAIKVLPDLTEQELVSSEFAIIALNNGEVLTTSPVIKTEVLAAVATSSPTPPLPSPTATATRSTTPSVTPFLLSTATPNDGVEVKIANQATSTPEAPESKIQPASGLAGVSFIILVVAALGIGVVGLIWFFKRR